MKVIKPHYAILIDWGGKEYIYKKLERIGRICYKSEANITEESAEKFIRNLIKRGHEAMLEHSGLTVIFTVDRGISHELVRHRLASFAQESTRYCDYSKDKFDHQLTFIKPFYLDERSVEYADWRKVMEEAEKQYLELISLGCTPQEARAVLPNSLKTEIAVTANFREWRHILKLRAAGTTGKPHPQMEEIMIPLLMDLKHEFPAIFDDIPVPDTGYYFVNSESNVTKIKE